MKLQVLEDFASGIVAIVKDEEGNFLAEAQIIHIKKMRNGSKFDFCHITAKAKIEHEEVVLEGNFYL